MGFKYLIEYSYNSKSPSDSSAYIHTRNNPPIYHSKVSKEDYDILDPAYKNEFLTNLFLIAGVVELSSTAYRIWIMKSPIYSWQEVLLPVLSYMAAFYGEEGLDPLPGSANIDGTGFTLEDSNQRRRL